MLAIRELRVNVKSLSAELRFIRHEMRRTRNTYEIGQLQSHRVLKVKPEARLAQLALAFVRQQPYRSVEVKTDKPVCAFDLARKLRRFVACNEEDVPKQREAVQKWLSS